MARLSTIDEKYMGSEPEVSEHASTSEMVRVYNWYNYFHDNDDAKKFVIDYLKTKKANTKIMRAVATTDSQKLRAIGWNCRILTKGGSLPAEIKDKTINTLNEIVGSALTTIKKKITTENVVSPVSIQERIENVAKEHISYLENVLDTFIIENKTDFDPSAWFLGRNIKAPVAKKIHEYYLPLYNEIYDVIHGDDQDLKEAYASWKRTKLKKYLELIRTIVSEAETQSVTRRKVRRPRAKKVKPAAELISKLAYMEAFKDETMALSSVNPVDIIGCKQLWLYNTKTRNLTELNAFDKNGLSVKGTSITGFDEKTSVVKKLRKPADVLSNVLAGNKFQLNRVMKDITTKPGKLTGRINSDTIILRVYK